MPGTARQSHEQQTHFLRKLVNFNDAGIAAGVLVGTVPAGSLFASCRVYIATAFNAATTNVLNVGLTATGGELIGTAQAVPGTVGRKVGTAVDSIGAPVAADADVFVSYTQTGTAATAGQAYVVIEYIPNIDR
jgi:hypothetical protein